MIRRKNKKGFSALLSRIYEDERTVGILLLAATLFSLLITNSRLGNAWLAFWKSPLPASHTLHLPHSLIHFVNDGLMALFFFLAGLEIRREMKSGELASWDRALLPGAAAIGGMLVPAILFTLLNRGKADMNGWAIPCATDIAFSLGIASLLGRRFPPSLKILLVALAIMDDLGAILIVAFYYGNGIRLVFLVAAGLLAGLMFLVNRRRKSFGWIQILPGILLWWLVYQSGIHATVAGVLFALLVPIKQAGHIEHKLLKPIHFLVVPLFALANTAIVISPGMESQLLSPLSLGIAAGLCLGKPLGIFGTTYLLVKRTKIRLPAGIGWSHIVGMGCLAGIGFTMSIFISTLAFEEDSRVSTAKLAVLLASVLSMLAGYLLLRQMKNFRPEEN